MSGQRRRSSRLRRPQRSSAAMSTASFTIDAAGNDVSEFQPAVRPVCRSCTRKRRSRDTHARARRASPRAPGRGAAPGCPALECSSQALARHRPADHVAVAVPANAHVAEPGPSVETTRRERTDRRATRCAPRRATPPSPPAAFKTTRLKKTSCRTGQWFPGEVTDRSSPGWCSFRRGRRERRWPALSARAKDATSRRQRGQGYSRAVR